MTDSVSSNETVAELRGVDNRPELAQIYLRHLCLRAADEIDRLQRELQIAQAEWNAWRDVANHRPSVQCSCGAWLKSIDDPHPCNRAASSHEPPAGLLSMSLRPDLPIVEFIARFDSLEHAQAARDAFTRLVIPTPPPPAEYTLDNALEFLDERAQWIDREMRNGGNLEHLKTRYTECRYITACIRDTRARLGLTKREGHVD